jgi:hypothetical protein
MVGAPEGPTLTSPDIKVPVPEVLTKIPFNRPYVTGAEFAYVQQAIEAMHLSGRRRC